MLVLGAWDFSATGSPKIPRAAPDDPDTEQEIRDGVRRHRVAEPVLAENQPLIRRAAQHAREPFIVGKAKDERGRKKRKR